MRTKEEIKKWRSENYIKKREIYLAQRKIYREQFPEKVREQKKMFYLKHKEKINKKNREWQRLRGHIKTDKRSFSTYSHRARMCNREFSLEFDYFVTLIHSPCHYCGRSFEFNGVDRKDSSKGYTVDNSLPCCADCNRGKLAMSYEEWIALCKLIASRFN